jgi:hypothetical protein
MAYKRFPRTWETFSITGFEASCAENEFFNSHRPYHQVGWKYGLAIMHQLRRTLYFRVSNATLYREIAMVRQAVTPLFRPRKIGK